MYFRTYYLEKTRQNMIVPRIICYLLATPDGILSSQKFICEPSGRYFSSDDGLEWTDKEKNK